MKKFAYILMGSSFDPDTQQSCYKTPNAESWIFTVQDFAQAKQRALECKQQGFGAIELCGAFGEVRAREIAALTDNQLVVGYVQNLPEHAALVEAFFGG